MNALIKKAEVAYGWFLKAVNGLQSPFLLLIRVYWGWLFLQSGIGKFGHIDKVVSFFTDLGIPAPTLNAYFNASLETIGGILLILGLASRLIAVPLLINMVVAYITADREAFTSFLSIRKIFWRRPIPIPAGVIADSDLWPGKVLRRYAGSRLSQETFRDRRRRCIEVKQMVLWHSWDFAVSV
jgi:putative oxidoreductase